MPEMVENRMVVDWQWPDEQPEIREKLSGAGYREIGTEVFVPEESAFDYAIERCVTVPFMVIGIEWTQEFKEMLVEWFYSGNWVKEG